MSKAHPSGGPWRNFYGRFKGKSLNKAQENRLINDLDRLSPGVISWEDNPERKPLDLNSLFEGKDVWLEIGFGGGEHLVHQAKENPGIGFIGCEPYLNGVAMLLGKIESERLNNIRVYSGDARHLFDVLPPQSISRVFLLYPDPWPKKRHHRRRFVTQEHIAPLAQVMKKDAIFRVATDIKDYVRQTLQEVPANGFNIQTELPQDLQIAWPDWISTRYEQKALREGRTPHYLTFKRHSQTTSTMD